MSYVVIFICIGFMLIFWFGMLSEGFSNLKKHLKTFTTKEPKYKSVLYDRLFNDDGSWVLKDINSSVPLSQDKTEYILNNYNYDIISDEALNSVMVYYPDNKNKLYHFIMSIVVLIFIAAICFIAIPYAVYNLH